MHLKKRKEQKKFQKIFAKIYSILFYEITLTWRLEKVLRDIIFQIWLLSALLANVYCFFVEFRLIICFHADLGIYNTTQKGKLH